MSKKRKKSKRNVKVIVKKIPNVTPTKDESSRFKKEIRDLEESKKNTGKGVRGVLRRMAIQKQISDKAKFFKARDNLLTTRKATELVKSQVELEEARAKLKEARKKSQVNFEGFGYPQQKKELKINDIFN